MVELNFTHPGLIEVNTGRRKSMVFLLFIVLLLSVVNCQKHSSEPDELKLDESHSNLTQKNLERISEITLNDPHRFSFALISDNHTDYADLQDLAESLNDTANLTKSLLVIHAGDLTDFGWLSEYKRTVDILAQLTIPYLTVIGNHDELTSGRGIYSRMFGDFNYSFVLGDCKFVLLEANSLSYLGVPPNLGWLEEELSDNDSYRFVFVVGHPPPFDPGWNEQEENRYRLLMQENNVALSVHGHEHYFWYGDRYGDGVKYLVVDDAASRNHCTVSVDSLTFGVEKINLSP
jgi:predicted phosphodiesterase